MLKREILRVATMLQLQVKSSFVLAQGCCIKADGVGESLKLAKAKRIHNKNDTYRSDS